MNRPKVSIIIPCHNDGIYLPEALDSIDAAEIMLPLEIIVVDDGSEDARTEGELVRAAERGARVLRREIPGGPATARNAGIATSDGTVILPLDVDNRLRCGYLETAMELFEACPEVGVVYGDAALFGEREGHWRMGPYSLGNQLVWNRIDNCAPFRREVWEAAGGYPEDRDLVGFEDWALWLAAAFAGWEFVYIPQVVFDYRVRDGSVFDPSKAQESRRILRDRYAGLLDGALGRLAEIETDLPLHRGVWELVRRRVRARSLRRRAARIFREHQTAKQALGTPN